MVLAVTAASGFGSGAGAATTWNISKAVYTGKTTGSLGADTWMAVTFKPDGTKMYVLGDKIVYQHSLSTAWDVSTDSSDSKSFDHDANTSPDTPNQNMDIAWNYNGTKWYMVDVAFDAVYQYTASTAYDVSTLSFDSVELDTSGQDTSPRSMYWKTDGTSVYLGGDVTDDVFQYNLTGAWDLSSASYASKFKSVGATPNDPSGLFMSDDGTKMFVNNSGAASGVTSTMYQWTMSTPWDVSTATYDSVSFVMASQDTEMRGMFWHPDGDRFYIIGNDGNAVFEYSTG